MEHVVFFPASDGNPAFRRLPSLQEAVDFVEHLRNEQDVQDVSVHSLAAVPLAFRTVYRVEVAGAVPAPAEPVEPPAADAGEAVQVADAAAADEEAAPMADASMAESVDEAPVEAANDAPVENGQVVGVGTDGRSLGFFAD